MGVTERKPGLPVVSSGAEPRAHAPVRTCVGCRVRAPVTGLLRVVVQGATLTPDPRRRLLGRGAAVHPTEECVGLAEKRRAFGRALRAPGVLDVSAVRAYAVHLVSGPTRELNEEQVENP